MGASEADDRAAQAEAVVHELFFTPDGRAESVPAVSRTRELAPVFRSERLQAWLLTRYDDCKGRAARPAAREALRGVARRAQARWRERPGLQWSSRTMLNLDGPEHTRLRRLVVREFTPRTVEALRPQVEAMVDDLLDAMHDVGELMEELAFQLPISVIGMLLGVPPEDRPQFRELTQRLTGVFELSATREMLDAADAAVLDCIAYFDALIDGRARPARRPPEPVDRDGRQHRRRTRRTRSAEQRGVEHSRGAALPGRFRDDDQPHRQRDDLAALAARADGDAADAPELCANVAEELLRHDGTVQLASRYATTDIAFGDVTIPAGEGVFILLGAANRDPRYPDPDRIDFTRERIQPLSFGGGVHLCLGAPLARLETEVVFRKLSERYAAIELDGELPPHRDRLTLRAPWRCRSGCADRAPVRPRSGHGRRVTTSSGGPSTAAHLDTQAAAE